jgi:hypothetical protein
MRDATRRRLRARRQERPLSSAAWVTQPARNLADEVFRAEGIEIVPPPVEASPANGIAERFAGSLPILTTSGELDARGVTSADSASRGMGRRAVDAAGSIGRAEDGFDAFPMAALEPHGLHVGYIEKTFFQPSLPTLMTTPRRDICPPRDRMRCE